MRVGVGYERPAPICDRDSTMIKAKTFKLLFFRCPSIIIAKIDEPGPTAGEHSSSKRGKLWLELEQDLRAGPLSMEPFIHLAVRKKYEMQTRPPRSPLDHAQPEIASNHQW